MVSIQNLLALDDTFEAIDRLIRKKWAEIDDNGDLSATQKWEKWSEYIRGARKKGVIESSEANMYLNKEEFTFKYE